MKMKVVKAMLLVEIEDGTVHQAIIEQGTLHNFLLGYASLKGHLPISKEIEGIQLIPANESTDTSKDDSNG